MLTILAFALAASTCAGPVPVERTAYLMGTTLRLEVRGTDRECALAASEAALAEVARLEGVLSSWSAESEVGRLNRAEPGRPHRISVELAGLLGEARGWHARTGGAFDPGVGALVSAWELRGAGRIPAPAELAQARRSSGLEALAVSGSAVVRPDSAWWLDSGGFGKGAALRAAASVLATHGVRDAVLDFGGQVLVLGAAQEVGVADPRLRTEAASVRLQLAGASIATTACSERWVSVAGSRFGHVLDPRSGRPAAAWGSVSVVGTDALAVDALSTALFVMGPAAALAWAAANPEFGVLVQEITAAGVRITASPGLEAFLVSPIGTRSGETVQ